MKFKQLLLIVAVSAASAVGSVWTYGKLTNQNNVFVQTAERKLPVNYAGFFENPTGAAEPVDFTKAANAAVPAVVHIKTKIPARKISNELPGSRSRQNNPEDWFEQFFNFHF